MKNLKLNFILAGFLLSSLITLSQSNNYPDTTIKKINYYQYKVLPGEGLLSIGRKFKLTIEEIIKANPEVKDGLKIGQQILVPSHKKPGKKTTGKTNSSSQFIEYKVAKRQTLFNICQKFKISDEDLLKYNPSIKNGIKEGMILQIPKLVKENKKKETEKTVKVDSKTISTNQIDKKAKYITHKVQPKETLFSISRRYKIDIKDIIHLNPGCDSNLVVGSDLRIPNVGTLKTKDQKKENILTGKKSTSDEIKIIENPNTTKYTDHRVIKIAYILPLMLDQVKKDQSDERFINFYEGSLLAIKEAKQRGISIEIFTYDTEKSEDRIKEILNNAELKSVDLIIGPAYSNLVPLVEDFAKENKINIVIPFTSKVPDIDTNPYLFQFNPGQDSELDFFTELISGKYKNTHVIFAEAQDINSLDDGKIRVEALQKKLTSEHRTFSTIQLVTPENVNYDKVLKKGEKNLIIFNTDKYSYVSPFLNPLSSKTKLFDIVLFEQYNWRSQTDKSFHSIFISPFITKFNSSAINEFNLQFDQYFGKDVTTDSPRYDLLGYDLSNFFISVIHRNGSKFGNKINSVNLGKFIQSEPLFERSDSKSGFINHRVYLGEDKAN